MKWKKKSDNFNNYDLVENGHVIGNLKFDSVASTRAVCQFGKNRFSIEMEGLWKNKKLVKDAQGNIIARTHAEKWYGATEILEIAEKRLKMKFRNNPLAEYIIFEEEETPLVSCRLDGAKVDFSVSEAAKALPFWDVLSALAWYSFKNIAAENTIDYPSLVTEMADNR